MADDDDFVRITLRIPKPLHAQLGEAAGGKKSMNAEIIARLEASFDSPGLTQSAEFLERTVNFAVSKTFESTIRAIQATAAVEPDKDIPRDRLDELTKIFEQMRDRTMELHWLGSDREKKPSDE